MNKTLHRSAGVGLATLMLAVSGCGNDKNREYAQKVNAAEERFGHTIQQHVASLDPHTALGKNELSAVADALRAFGDRITALKPPKKSQVPFQADLVKVTRDYDKIIVEYINDEDLASFKAKTAFTQKRFASAIAALNAALEG